MRVKGRGVLEWGWKRKIRTGEGRVEYGRGEEESINKYITITPITQTPARNTEPDIHTNTHHTPQPSTPIKHAGSDI